MTRSIRFFIFALGLFASTTLFAAVKPASLFAEHMVLQRNILIPVWGTANPGE